MTQRYSCKLPIRCNVWLKYMNKKGNYVVMINLFLDNPISGFIKETNYRSNPMSGRFSVKKGHQIFFSTRIDVFSIHQYFFYEKYRLLRELVLSNRKSLIK